MAAFNVTPPTVSGIAVGLSSMNTQFASGPGQASLQRGGCRSAVTGHSLRLIGCDEMQGGYFCEPVPFATCVASFHGDEAPEHAGSGPLDGLHELLCGQRVTRPSGCSRANRQAAHLAHGVPDTSSP